jgi:hypothetical protein
MARKRSTIFDVKNRCVGRNISFPHAVLIALHVLHKDDASEYVSNLVIKDIGPSKIDKIYNEYMRVQSSKTD